MICEKLIRMRPPSAARRPTSSPTHFNRLDVIIGSSPLADHLQFPHSRKHRNHPLRVLLLNRARSYSLRSSTRSSPSSKRSRDRVSWLIRKLDYKLRCGAVVSYLERALGRTDCICHLWRDRGCIYYPHQYCCVSKSV